MFEVRIGSVSSSAFGSIQRTREVSPFVAQIKAQVAGLEDGQAVFVSHKSWVDSLNGKVITKASEKNGPRYTLKRYDIACVAGNLSGAELAEQSEVEGRELLENDIIYRCSKAL